MSDIVDALVRDLVAFVADRPRPYDEVMAAWRTSCPRLPVWETALARGLVERRPAEGGRPAMVRATAKGLALLAPAPRRLDPARHSARSTQKH